MVCNIVLSKCLRPGIDALNSGLTCASLAPRSCTLLGISWVKKDLHWGQQDVRCLSNSCKYCTFWMTGRAGESFYEIPQSGLLCESCLRLHWWCSGILRGINMLLSLILISYKLLAASDFYWFSCNLLRLGWTRFILLPLIIVKQYKPTQDYSASSNKLSREPASETLMFSLQARSILTVCANRKRYRLLEWKRYGHGKLLVMWTCHCRGCNSCCYLSLLFVIIICQCNF